MFMHRLIDKYVDTIYGKGRVLGAEGVDGILSKRLAVELVNNPFWYSPVYFHEDELK